MAGKNVTRALAPGQRTRNTVLSKIELLPEEAKEILQIEVKKRTPTKKIAEILTKKTGINITVNNINQHLRREADKLEFAKRRIEKIREWTEIITQTTNKSPQTDTTKLLTNLIQGDVLQFMITADTQARMGDLSFDKVADIALRIANFNNQKEKIELQKRTTHLFETLEEKNTARNKGKSENTPQEINPELTKIIKNLKEQFGEEQLKNALIEAGIMPPPKNNQGLDPETLKTIREEVYGIFK